MYKSIFIIGRSVNIKNYVNVFCGDLFFIKIMNEIFMIVMDYRVLINVYNEIYDVFNRNRMIDIIVNINSNWMIGFFIFI